MLRLLFVMCSVILFADARNLTAEIVAPRPAIEAPHPYGVAPQSVDHIDLLFLGEQPVVIRVRIQNGDQTYLERWQEQARTLYDQLDADNDGMLDSQEARSIPDSNSEPSRGVSKNPVLRFFGSRKRKLATDETIDNQPRDGKVSFHEFTLHLQQNQKGAFLPNLVNNLTQVPEDFTKLLDTDEDQKLTAQEFRNGLAKLRPFDTNDDEVLSFNELNTSTANAIYGVAYEEVQGGDDWSALDSVIMQLTGKLTYQKSEGILNLYDPRSSDKNTDPRDLAIPAATWNLKPNIFAKFDTDNDGKWNGRELDHYLTDPVPHCEFLLNLGALKPQERRIQLLPGQNSIQPVKVTRSRDGFLTLHLFGTYLELGARSATQNGGQSSFFTGQFDVADGDNNGYLDRQEANSNFYMRSMFENGDRDGDGMFFKKELETYLKSFIAEAQSRTVLSVTDYGRDLFEAVDRDRDRRIKPRELQQAGWRMKSWDRNQDGSLSRKEIPRQVRLLVSPAQPVFPGFGQASIAARPVRTRPISKGPLWFRKMDSNQDGDVSRREFLGPLDDFDRMDKNKDGVLFLGEVQGKK